MELIRASCRTTAYIVFGDTRVAMIHIDVLDNMYVVKLNMSEHRSWRSEDVVARYTTFNDACTDGLVMASIYLLTLPKVVF